MFMRGLRVGKSLGSNRAGRTFNGSRPMRSRVTPRGVFVTVCLSLLLTLVSALSFAEAEGGSSRNATISVNLSERQGPLDIDKVASLGQGGQSEDPIWEGRAAEVRALRPRVIRLFLQ